MLTLTLKNNEIFFINQTEYKLKTKGHLDCLLKRNSDGKKIEINGKDFKEIYPTCKVSSSFARGHEKIRLAFNAPREIVIMRSSLVGTEKYS